MSRVKRVFKDGQRSAGRWLDTREPADLESADLCDRAWDAVTGPILRHAATWRLAKPPRLMLIPTGLLRTVPWHAARTTEADGGPHHAVADAMFSYAASARQFADALGRPRRPLAEAAVLVSNPTGDLPMAGYEARMLHRQYYPEAVFLGRSANASGEGTPEQVLARRPRC